MIDKIKQIKKLRVKPEEIWFLDLITNLEEVKSDKYTKSVFFKKNNIVLFEQNFENNQLLINYNEIWSIFENKYYYNYHQTEKYIKKIVCERLKWYDFKLGIGDDLIKNYMVGKLNWLDFTPLNFGLFQTSRWINI